MSAGNALHVVPSADDQTGDADAVDPTATGFAHATYPPDGAATIPITVRSESSAAIGVQVMDAHGCEVAGAGVVKSAASGLVAGDGDAAGVALGAGEAVAAAGAVTAVGDGVAVLDVQPATTRISTAMPRDWVRPGRR